MTEPGKETAEAAVRDLHKVEAELLYLFFFSREGRSVALSNSLMHRSIAA